MTKTITETLIFYNGTTVEINSINYGILYDPESAITQILHDR